MPPDTSAADARAQLRALAARPGAGVVVPPGLPRAEQSRPAAVLILFGVLDSLPADRDAQAPAVSRDLDVLLLTRASTLRSHPGQVAFPGGRVDPEDDGVVAAALREAREETGLDPAGVEVLGTLAEIPLAYSRHLVTPVLGWWRHPSAVGVVDERESAAVFRAPVAMLLDPAHRGTTVLRRGAAPALRGPGFLVPHEGTEHLVWGFTAMLLDGLFDALGWTEPWDRERELRLPPPPRA